MRACAASGCHRRNISYLIPIFSYNGQVDSAHRSILLPAYTALQPMLLRMHPAVRKQAGSKAAEAGNVQEPPAAAVSGPAKGYAAAFSGTQALLKRTVQRLQQGSSAVAALLRVPGRSDASSSNGSSTGSSASAAALLQRALAQLRCKLWAWK